MLIIAVFVSGMTTLAIELTASRLLGNVFGTSNLVWANVIGLMLLYLTVGYFVGGWLADRFPTRIAFFRIIAWGAFFGGLVPFVARPVLSGAAGAVIGFQAGAALGSFVAVLCLFALPITLLGCVSPFAIRLAVSDPASAGKISGRMYAISTLGSLLGTFLPTLWLIPEAGTTRTFVIFAGVALSVALIGLIRQGKAGRRAAVWLIWQPLVLIALTLTAPGGALRPPPEGRSLLWEKDSAYNYIQVTELKTGLGWIIDGQWVELWKPGTRELYLNEGQGVHSVYHPDGGFYGGTWDMFLAAPFVNTPPFRSDQVKSLAVIGLAAGTISTQYTAVFGVDVNIDGIEIDPDIVEAGRRYFGMNQPNLKVIIEDGRLGLRLTSGMYDVVAIDAYRVPYVPWHLTTVEFFREVRERLSPQGMAVINVGRTANARTGLQDRRLVEAMTHTMQQVFPTVHTLDVPDSFNTILIGTLNPTTPANLAANLALLPPDADPLLRRALEAASRAFVPSTASTVLFTDDRAPVETIINSMLIDYLLQ